MSVPVSTAYSATKGRSDALPRPYARLAGILYLLTIITGLAAFMLEGRLVVANNPAATAGNILSHESLFRLSSVLNLIGTACYVAITALFYKLFKPVSRAASLSAAFLSLIGCAMGAVSCAIQLAPLSLLAGNQYVQLFNGLQMHGLTLLLLKLSGLAYTTGMVFFGFYCVLIGYLTFRSTFLPRIVGVLMGLAGIGWLTFLWPPLAHHVASFTMLTGLLGEGSLTVWLLIMGVNVRRWQEQAIAGEKSRV